MRPNKIYRIKNGSTYKAFPISNGANLLAIETSGPALSVAVKKGKQKTRELSLKGRFRHVENLLPGIDILLKKEKLKLQDIDAFLISRGPGSFTGLRVGFATLKGFLAIRPKLCFGALSFDLIAANTPPERPGLSFVEARPFRGAGTLAVCLNAKRDKLYVRSYRYHKQGWKALGIPSTVSPEEWLKHLPEGTFVAGDGLEILIKGQVLSNCLSPTITVLPKKYWSPRASALISLYEGKSLLLKRLEKPKDLLPFYLRSSEAEEKLKSKKRT